MGISASVFLIAVGAILAFDVETTVEGIYSGTRRETIAEERDVV